jgi:hypothetical protein
MPKRSRSLHLWWQEEKLLLHLDIFEKKRDKRRRETRRIVAMATVAPLTNYLPRHRHGRITTRLLVVSLRGFAHINVLHVHGRQRGVRTSSLAISSGPDLFSPSSIDQTSMIEYLLPSDFIGNLMSSSTGCQDQMSCLLKYNSWLT